MNRMRTHHRHTPPQICFGALLLAALNAVDLSAQQQVTVENLLQNSVEQVGPEHKDVSKAIEVFLAGNLLEARNLLESAKVADATLPPAGILMARLLYAAKQPALARNELERVAKDDPLDPETYVLFGELAIQQRRFSDAELAYQKAGQLARNFSENPIRKKSITKRTFSGLAGVAEAREDWTTAAKYLEPILNADPSDVNNTTRMAQSLFRQAQEQTGDEKDAKEKEAYGLLQKLWNVDKSIRRPEITMGLLYENAGDRARAERLMKYASERDTDGMETQLAVARWAMETGDLELAQTCSDRAVTIAPNSVEAILAVGLVARYQRDYAKARRQFELAHLRSPTNLAAVLQLAVVLAEQSEDLAALAYAEIGRRIYPDMSQPSGREAAVTLAWILFRQGRGSEAQRTLQQALTGGGVSAESSYYAARILHQAGNRDSAKTLLQAALRNDRVFPARGEAEKLLSSLGGDVGTSN